MALWNNSPPGVKSGMSTESEINKKLTATEKNKCLQCY